MTTKAKDLHWKWMKSPEYRKAHDAQTPEFELARVNAGLTQEQLAARMETTQSAIARLESGRGRPSNQTLERVAIATGTRLKITFEAGRAQP
jgi:ribosome-binding protein aMBF1 (putative translation factor)